MTACLTPRAGWRATARRTGGIALALAALAAGMGVHAARQSASPAVTVTIGAGSAPPDAPVTLPLELSTAKRVGVGAVEIRLSFPRVPLFFLKIEPSGTATAAGARVQAEVKASGRGSSVLHARVSTVGQGGSRKPLPEGTVAYLVFRIDEQAESGPLALGATARATSTDDPPVPLAPVAVTTVPLVVLERAETGCFFYMH